MKKFWLVLLSLGLVMAFSVSAFAVDVKVGAEYYAAGLYLNKTSLYDGPWEVPVYKYEAAKYKKDGTLDKAAKWTQEKGDKGIKRVDEPGSTAFFFQRLRVGTDFIVSPCLKLVTRFDAMERIWGGARSNASSTTLAVDSAGTRAENENIAFDWAYVNYVASVGTFDIGYMNSGATGTIFGNSATPAGRIKYYSPLIKDAININADITKTTDKSYSAVTSASATDTDKDAYAIEGVYNFKTDKASGKAAMKIAYTRDATARYSDDYKSTYLTITPWAMAKVGPVALQAELNWATGDYTDSDEPAGTDVKLDNLSFFLDATATFAPIYVGGSFAYISGDDPGTTDKREGGTLTGGRDWNPCLLLFNNDITYWVGEVSGHNYSVLNGTMKNAWFFQGRVGVKPTPQWDVMLSVSHAFVDKKPKMPEQAKKVYLNGTYGTEIDLVSTYKITNNLSYMLGMGYLFTGDYFKGAEFPAGEGPFEVQNDFIVINKLTLSF